MYSQNLKRSNFDMLMIENYNKNIKSYDLQKLKKKSKYKYFTVRFLSDFYISGNTRFSFQDFNQFCRYFLPHNYIYKRTTDKADICIVDMYVSKAILSDEEFNVLVSVENIPHWNHSNFVNENGYYGNDKIDLYYYNHTNQFTYNTIPTVYAYIREYELCNFNNKVKWKDKKDILMVNKSGFNKDIQKFQNEILTKTSLNIDNISQYSEQIETESCYHSQKLLNVMNKYKFILCVENSYTYGYVTEKIFNCFAAKTIPIYSGAPDIDDYINKSSYISVLGDWIQEINKLSTNEEEYNKIINQNPIKPNMIYINSKINNMFGVE